VATARDPQPEPPAAVVRLPTLQPTTDLGVFIAALTISSLIPIALVLLFRRLFLGGQGLSGAIKG
jgi:multiple sugar transport system permease protein